MNGGLAGGTFLNTYSTYCPNWTYPQLTANAYVKVDAFGKLVPWDGSTPPPATFFQTQKLLVQPVNSDAQTFAVKDNTGSSFFTVSTLPMSPLITSYVRHLFNGLASFTAGFTVLYGNAQFNTSLWAGVTSGTAAINTVDINATSSVTAAAFNTPTSATTSTLNNPTVFNGFLTCNGAFSTNGSTVSIFNVGARFNAGILANTTYAQILTGYFGNTSTATSALNTTTLSVDSNANVGGNLSAAGTTSLGILGTSGAATLYSLTVTTNAVVNSLLVTNNETISGNLTVVGTATLGSVSISSLSITNLSITGNLSVALQGNFGGAYSGAQLNTGTFYASGLSQLAAVQATSLSTSGLATLNSLSVTNNSTLSGTLGVTGATTLSNASVTGTLGVTGLTTLGGATATLFQTYGLATLSSLSVPNNALVMGNTSMNGTLTVTGSSVFTTLSSSALATFYSLAVTNNATVGGTLGVTGATTLSNASVTGTLGVTGLTTLASATATLFQTYGLATLSSLSVPNNALVMGNTSMNGTLTVTGSSVFTTLSSSALATFYSLAVTNNATVGGTLGVTGNTTLSTLSSGLHTITTSGSGVAKAISIYSTTTSGTYPAISFYPNNSTTHGFIMYYGDTTTLCLNPVLTGDLSNIVSQDGSNTISLGSSSWPYNAYLKNLIVTILGTINALTVTNAANLNGNTTVGGTLGVTGATTLSTLSTSGLAIVNSLQVTNATTLGYNVTVGNTLGVTGATTLSTLGTTGAATLNSLQVTNGTVCAGTFNPGSTANGTWTACPTLTYYMLSFTATGSYTAGTTVGSFIAFPSGKTAANIRRVDLYIYDGTNFLESGYTASSGYAFNVAINPSGVGVVCATTVPSLTRTFYMWLAST